MFETFFPVSQSSKILLSTFNKIPGSITSDQINPVFQCHFQSWHHSETLCLFMTINWKSHFDRDRQSDIRSELCKLKIKDWKPFYEFYLSRNSSYQPRVSDISQLEGRPGNQGGPHLAKIPSVKQGTPWLNRVNPLSQGYPNINFRNNPYV